MIDITSAQLRAAVALLNWSHAELATASGIPQVTVSRILSGKTKAQEKNLTAILRALSERDIMFLPNNGVALYPTVIRKLSGPKALNQLLDEVYETVKDGGDVCVTGTDESLYEKYHHEEKEGEHLARMSAIKGKISFRVILRHGDKNFPYDSYVDYRWMPNGKFKDNPFYLYGDKLAFIKMMPDGPEVWVFEMPSIASSFRDLFDVVWDQCTIPEGENA